MLYKTILIVFISLIYSTARAQRMVVILDSLDSEPIGTAVLTDSKTGKLISVSDTQGRAFISQRTQELVVSHLSFQSRLATIADTIYLQRSIRNFPEAIVASQPADYYRLRAVVRTYQYIDSIPVNFVDALLDFYVNGKGTKLQYDALQLDVYQNKSYINATNIAKGTATASTSSIINWIVNPHIATRGGDLYCEGTKVIRRKDKVEVGNLQKVENGDYTAKINLLLPHDTATHTFFGRSVRFTAKTLEQTFPSNIDLANIRPYDMSSYRFVVRRTTWTKKYPTPIHLTEIDEITIIDRERMTKEEVKQIDMDTNWTNLLKSKKREELQHPFPLPESIKRHIGQELMHLSNE